MRPATSTILYKFYWLLSFLLTGMTLASCSSIRSEAIRNHQGAEKLVTCSHEDDVERLSTAVQENRGFHPDDKNEFFWVPEEEIYAFDHRVKYVGLAGVLMLGGPNIFLAGDFDTVATAVEDYLGKDLECNDNICAVRLDKRFAVLVYRHRRESGTTIVQCGYFGR